MIIFWQTFHPNGVHTMSFAEIIFWALLIGLPLISALGIVGVVNLRHDVQMLTAGRADAKWFAIILLDKKQFILIPNLDWGFCSLTVRGLSRIFGLRKALGCWVEVWYGKQLRLGRTTSSHGDLFYPTMGPPAEAITVDARRIWGCSFESLDIAITWAKMPHNRPNWKTYLFYLFLRGNKT